VTADPVDFFASAHAALPAAMADLPRDHAGRPVPWFVAFIDGKPDFRVVAPGKLARALRAGLCWVCGRGFAGGEDRAWLIGPMCAVNLVTPEPPSHLGCAVWSAENCPFLTTPNMTRRDRHLPAGTVEPAGIMIRRNPGASVVWVTGYRAWKAERGSDGYLFRLGPAKRALWFACGREATLAEALASIDSGLPLLAQMAAADGPEAVAELAQMHAAALAYLPPEVPVG
jgi:hypothetical protein